MLIKQISIFVENRKGRLAEITGILSKNGINIRALSVADTTNFGVLRIIVDNPYETEKILSENRLVVSVTSVIGVRIDDRPGGLAEALTVLAAEGIQVEYMYAFLSKKDNKASVIMRIDDEFKAMQALEKNGYTGPDDLI